MSRVTFTRVRNLVFSPIFIALALGGFSTYLIAKGEVEAGMGGAGAAITAATMRRDEDDRGESDEIEFHQTLRIRELEIQLGFQRQLLDLEKDNLKLSEKCAIQSKTIKELEEHLKQQQALLLEQQKELSIHKALPDSKALSLESQKLEANKSQVGNLDAS
ncbi:hypothetical protein NDA01_25915 [Trichocoleus desertorum AS-A10]|uniref:hypothetical protein n=1 Tax=Trichocoleus desertorum TaxID=1481672 RepID=UPI00329937C4